MFVLNRGIDSFIDAFFLSLLCRFRAKVSKFLLFLRMWFLKNCQKSSWKVSFFQVFQQEFWFVWILSEWFTGKCEKKWKKVHEGVAKKEKGGIFAIPNERKKRVEGRGGRLAVLWKNGMDVANSSKIFLRRSDKVGTDKKAKEII